MSPPIDLTQRLIEVQRQLAEAAGRAGRAPESLTLLAVSKQHPVAAIRTLALAGQQHFGESYLQEALPKIDALQSLGLCWHFIGPVQGNKTRAVAEHFQWVHTLDRARIAQRLHDHRPQYAPPLNVCIQVKLTEESRKAGIAADALAELAHYIQQLSRLRLRGLMCIPPPQQQYPAQLRQFRQLADFQSQLNSRGFDLDTLSMGMSADYPAAIAAGASIVRLGTAVFGERVYSK